MREVTPLYLLATQSRSDIQGGRWQFVLEEAHQDFRVAETDYEPNMVGDRVALLAVVRGLEAIPDPGRVMLLTNSRYIHKGFKYGLQAWQEGGWKWERFGRRVPVRNSDLWARVAQAAKFHTIRLRGLDHISQPVSSASDGLDAIVSSIRSEFQDALQLHQQLQCA